jgi:hypothetical protein
LPGQAATSKFEITDYAEKQKIAFVGEPAGPAIPKASFLFEPAGNGTKITSRLQPEFRGFFKYIESMMVGYVRKNNTTHLSNLKQLLEA